MNLSGNTILITGGSSGIGLAFAKRFSSLKNQVIITGRDESKLGDLKKQHPDIAIFPCDLTRKEPLNNLVAFIQTKYPALNVLINNAAVQYNYSFQEEPGMAEKIDYEISANLAGPIKLTALLLPLLMQNSDSAIVNVGSGLYLAPKKSAPVYCATKAAIHSFSKALRYQLESTPAKVFEIIPALVDTPMTTGRGKSKITAEALVDEFLRDFGRDRFESHIGKAGLLKIIARIAPGIADRLMKNG